MNSITNEFLVDPSPSTPKYLESTIPTEILETNIRLQTLFPQTGWGYIGSNAIFGHGKDFDFVVYVPMDLITNFHSALKYEGFELEGATTEAEYKDDFGSFRKDRHNLLVSPDPDIFTNSVLAAYVCYRLQLHEREDRVKVHQIIVDKKTDGLNRFIIKQAVIVP